MNRRNFLQLLGAVALSGIVGNKADFALRRQREDEDRAIRLARLAADYEEQRAEAARVDAMRLEQMEEALQAQMAALWESYQA